MTNLWRKPSTHADCPQAFQRHPQTRTARRQRIEDDVVVILTIVAVVLYLAVTARCAELPDAPVQPEPVRHTQTWDRQLITATAVHGAVRIVDDVQTCHHLANGGHEYGFPTQSCAGVVAMNSAVYAGVTFASYELARHGHRKLAVALQYIGAGTDAAFIAIPRH